MVTAGFLVFVAGESPSLAGNAAAIEGNLPYSGARVALWSALLATMSAPPIFPYERALLAGRRSRVRRDGPAHRLD